MIEFDEEKAKDEILTQAAELLGEHFDNVLILVAFRMADNETDCFRHVSRGGWYGSKGLATQFVENEAAKNIAYQIKQTDDE